MFLFCENIYIIFIIPFIVIIKSQIISVPKCSCFESNNQIKDTFLDNSTIWDIKNSTNFPVGYVNDDRWNEFTNCTNHHFVFKSVSSISFSVWNPSQITFLSHNEDFREYFPVYVNSNPDEWHNFSLIIQNNNLYYIKDKQLLRISDNYKPRTIIIKTAVDLYWKLHNYSLAWSDRLSENSTVLKELEPGIWNVVVYSFLCKYCILEIFSSTSNETFKFMGEPNKEFYEQNWNKTNLPFKVSEVTKIFVKKYIQSEMTYQNLTFFGLDIRYCKTSGINTFKMMHSTILLVMNLSTVGITKIPKATRIVFMCHFLSTDSPPKKLNH